MSNMLNPSPHFISIADFQDSPFDCSTSKKQSHNTPQYLEKRMRRRKSTTILPGFILYSPTIFESSPTYSL